jgi:hypothetical protein
VAVYTLRQPDSLSTEYVMTLIFGFSMLIRILSITTILFNFMSLELNAWEGHFMLTYAALAQMPELAHKSLITSESLSSFLESEKSALGPLLKNYESWAQQNIQAYPALPPDLYFDAPQNPGTTLTQKFLYSIRVNPNLVFSNFVLYSPHTPHRIKNNFSAEEKLQAPISSLFAWRPSDPVVEKVLDKQQLTVEEILASGSEEPDHGLDFGLFADNESTYGKRMGFGEQPFGNPVVSFSSQAPFHMGFYFEKPLLYWVVGWLKRCYPEYRISLFLTLAEHAFKTHHDYWGYRFLGWALHYIQDLTQPYHATLVPGASWLKLIGLNSLELLGFKTPAQNVRQLLTNRHLALENYQLESTINLSSNDALKKALQDNNLDKKYPDFTFNYTRNIVAKEAHERATTTDNLLQRALPHVYVSDPTYIFPSAEAGLNLRELAFKKDPKEAQKLELDFLALMKSFGAHTRNALKSLLPKP